jgi:hypothetical protein
MMTGGSALLAFGRRLESSVAKMVLIVAFGLPTMIGTPTLIDRGTSRE